MKPLGQTEQQLVQLVAGVRDYAIFLLDHQGRITTWNEGAERIKGYRAEEIIGRHFSCFYPEEAVSAGWPEHELEVAEAQGRFEDEGWRVRKDGSRFWANVVITAFRGERGELKGFLKITRDLTERREAEENARRLLQAEAAQKAAEASTQEIARAREEERRHREQLEVTLRSIGDAVIVTDVNGHVTFMNPVAVDLTGWQVGEAAGRPLKEVFHIVNEQSRELVEDPVSKVLRHGMVVGLANHTVLISKDGREIPIDDSGAPIQGVDGAVAGVVLVFRDVTEARRAVEARLHLAAIVESSEDAIIGQSLEGRILSWNRGAERLYGYRPDEILGQPLALLVPPDHPDELPHLMEQIQRGEHIEHFETERMRKDGSRVDVSLTISPIRNSEGEIIGSSKVARDITARKQEDRRKTEFLALLAHELRNPLAALRSGVQVIQRRGLDDQSAKEVGGVMERQLQHLVRLVDDLLDVSRISRGKLELRMEQVQVADVLTTALETCRGLIDEQDQTLSVSIPEEPLYIQGDTTRLAQAICNLVSNASKFSDPGSEIQVIVTREGEEVILRVKDFGMGIPSDMLSKVFDMFIQADQSLERSQSGLGVGLTIVQRLVEMHGGAVEARSEGLGKGSEFTIRLPLAAPHANEQQHPPAQPPRCARCHRVLIADDNKDAARTLAMLLQIMGHETQIAHDGSEAVAMAERFRPNLILLDIGMPRLNGYEACRSIREKPWSSEMVIVALTGWGQSEDKARSEEAGFDDHLVKPVNPTELEELLAKLTPTAE